MKKSILLLAILSANTSVHAESRVLPPVIDNSTYPSNSSHNSPTAPSANAMYEVLGRLEQLQMEVQQLRGVVEEQSQTIIDLKKRQSNIYSDLDLRIQAITGEAPQLNAGTSTNLTAPAVNSESSSPTQSSNVVPNPVASATVNTTTNTQNKNQKELYQAAYETLRNGHNSRAIAEFKSFLTDYPDGEYADNAQYWLAEAYKVNQDINAAKLAFNKVVTQYKNSPKVPDALFKLGSIELDQKNIPKARDYLTQITVNYPETTAAHLASKKLQQIEMMQP